MYHFVPELESVSWEVNDIEVSGASYLSVVAPYTFDSLSKLTFWLYDLPLE